MFAEIAARFATLPDTETPSVPAEAPEQREHQRYYFQALAAAKIYPLTNQRNEMPQVCYVLARDISQGGISVLHPVALSNGQILDLQFADGRARTAQVRWCRQVESDCCIMGCKFV
jgi:hypothetical protein